MIERLSEAIGEALVSNNFFPISLKISFHMKKNVFCQGQISTKH